MRYNTPKGVIRHAEQSDHSFLCSLFSYPDVQKYCNVVAGTNLSAFCQVLVQNSSGTLIIENESGRNVGCMLMTVAPLFNGTYNAFWLIYAIDPQYRGKGYATNALRVMVSMSNQSPLPVALLIHLDNYKSIHIAEKCGFRKQNLGVGTKPDGSKATNEGLWLLM